MWKFVSNTIIKSLMSMMSGKEENTVSYCVMCCCGRKSVICTCFVCDICKREQMSLGTYIQRHILQTSISSLLDACTTELETYICK